MSGISGLKVVFVAGFGPLVKDPAASNAFYVDALGLPLEQQAERIHIEGFAGGWILHQRPEPGEKNDI